MPAVYVLAWGLPSWSGVCRGKKRKMRTKWRSRISTTEFQWKWSSQLWALFNLSSSERRAWIFQPWTGLEPWHLQYQLSYEPADIRFISPTCMFITHRLTSAGSLIKWYNRTIVIRGYPPTTWYPSLSLFRRKKNEETSKRWGLTFYWSRKTKINLRLLFTSPTIAPCT